MATKYKKYFQLMVDQNKEIFDKFLEVHAKYDLEGEKWQKSFNEIGGKVNDIINEYEGKLCRTSENSGYSAFTPKLAEKFREEVRTHFPKIDFVGVEVKERGFELPKIKL